MALALPSTQCRATLATHTWQALSLQSSAVLKVKATAFHGDLRLSLTVRLAGDEPRRAFAGKTMLPKSGD